VEEAKAKAAAKKKAKLRSQQRKVSSEDLEDVKERSLSAEMDEMEEGLAADPDAEGLDDDGFAVGVGMSESKYGEVGGSAETKAKAKARAGLKREAVSSEEELLVLEEDEQKSMSGDDVETAPAYEEDLSSEDLDDDGFAVGVSMRERRYGQVSGNYDDKSPVLQKKYKGLDRLIAKLKGLEEEQAALDENTTMSKAKKAQAQKRLIRDIKATKAEIKAAKAGIKRIEKAEAKLKQSKAKAVAKKAGRRTVGSLEDAPQGMDESVDDDGFMKKSRQPAVSRGVKTFPGDFEEELEQAETMAEVQALADDLEPDMTKEQKYELNKLRAKHAREEKKILEMFDDDVSREETKVRQKYDPASGETGEPYSGGTSADDLDVASAISRVPTSGTSGDGSLKTENAALRKKVNDLIAMSKEDQAVIEKLEYQSTMSPAEKKRLKASLDRTEKNLKGRRGAVQGEGTRMQELHDRIEELENELNSGKYNFKDKQLDYEKKLQDILDELDDTKYVYARSEQDFLDQLAILKEALRQKIAELNAAEEKLIFTEYKLKQLQARYDNKNKQFEGLQKTLVELESRMSELQDNLGADDLELSKVEPGKFPPPKTREEAIYQRWIQRHDRLVTKLKEKLLWAHQQMEYYGQYDIKLSEDKMAVLKQEIAQLKKQLNSKDVSRGGKEDYELMEERLQDTQERLNMVEKILKEKEGQIQELESQLNGALSNF